MIDPNLREQLLTLETETPSLKEKYRKEIAAMLEKELSIYEKMGLIASIVMGAFLFLGGFITVLVMAIKGNSSFLLMSLLLVSAVFGLVGIVYGSWFLYQGKINIKQHRQIEMTVIWSFCGLLVFLFMLYGASSKNSAEGALRILFGYPILFILVLATLHRYIEKTGLELKEHILRLELHIAELNEKMNPKPENDKKE